MAAPSGEAIAAQQPQIISSMTDRAAHWRDLGARAARDRESSLHAGHQAALLAACASADAGGADGLRLRGIRALVPQSRKAASAERRHPTHGRSRRDVVLQARFATILSALDAIGDTDRTARFLLLDAEV
jgi:hypothetical protein